MNFDPEDDTPEIALFRSEVRGWLEENIGSSRHLRWSSYWSTRDNEDEYQFRRELAGKLGAKGWLFPMFPTEYGGGGLTADHQFVIEEEIATFGLELGHVFYTLAVMVAPCVLHWGTEAQRRDLLPDMTKGLVSVWQLLTEPQGGSDPATCLTKAERVDDVYVVNGQKVMVGSTHPPEFLWTLVCTDPQGERHKNLSWLYIPASLAGITITPLPMMMGTKNAVFFDDVRVPLANLIGGENNGWGVSTTHLEIEHGEGSVTRNAAVERLFQHCREQSGPTGQKLIDDPNVRRVMAEALIDSHAAYLLGLRNLWYRLQRRPHPYGGAQYFYLQRMLKLNTARRVQEVLGYTSLLEDLSVDEMADFQYAVRSGPGELHGAGTLDTDRVVIARRLGLGRKTSEVAPETI